MRACGGRHLDRFHSSLKAPSDIDLSILGADADRFAEYEQQIRDEYAHVPTAEFEARRREIMARFAQRRPLYRTAAIRDAREAQARINLAVANR